MNARMKTLLSRTVAGAALILGGLFNQAAAETITYIHTDALGSPVAETDAAGSVIRRTTYEPYGAAVGELVADGPGYTGHVTDASTGLSYMQQRYMDSQLGVFLSVDPVSAMRDPVGAFGRYRYANSNPYRYFDPDGRRACGKDTGCQLEQGALGGSSGVSRSSTGVRSTSIGGQRLVADETINRSAGANGTSELVRNWSLSQVSPRGGAIVQDISVTVEAYDRAGRRIVGLPSTRYWEAWTVSPGSSVPTPYGQDTFKVNRLPSEWHRGKVTWSGSARFYEGLSLPSSFVPGGVGFAGVLPSTSVDPKLSTSSATPSVDGRFQVEWP